MNDNFSMDCKVEEIATKNPKMLKQRAFGKVMLYN